ncbi:MAG: CocE/NonD family hydrolase [Actinomycetota bacterium]|nr:CocE/NonD family hydrolase [Actinomycetota bacterium]
MNRIEEITVQTNVPATMRDGTTLMANVYRTAGDGEYPVLLTRLPYGKDQPRDFTYFDPARAARRGYIVVVQDVRGRFASEGEFASFPQEMDDGHDSVEWAAKLPGSNGKVGMWGLSYFGKTQWHAATTRPPSLMSMVPGQTWGNHLNGASLRGGAQELGLIQLWTQGAIAPHEIFRKYATDPEKLNEKLLEVIGIVNELLAGGGYDALPLSDLPDPGGLTAASGLGRGVEDPIWDHLNIDGKYDRIEAPTFHIGGWHDCFIGETLRQYEAMKAHSEEAGMRPPRLLVGPWTHAGFGTTFGDLDFGMTSTGGFINADGDFTERHLRWFDATLKDDEEALANRPPVEIFVMGENRWRGYEEWPVPGSREESWYLGSGYSLSQDTPGAESPDEYDYDPRDPVPTIGGPSLLADIHRPGACDQREVEGRSDVLVYTSEVLRENYTVIGAVHATLFAASSAPDTDFVVRLVDVYPDGRAIGVADGVLRAGARESYPAPGIISPTAPSPIVPGEVYEYAVDLWATGITFLAGHRIRVDITSSSFPRWDRNPNTGESSMNSARTQVARQTIFHDPDRPSHVTLMVADGQEA